MVGTPPAAGRRPVRPGQDPGRGRRRAGRVGADRQPLACPLARRRDGGDAHRPPGQAGPARTRRAGQDPAGAGPRGGGGGVRQRPVDAGAGGRGDRAGDGSGAPSRARVAPAQGDAVEPAASGPQGRRARRGQDRPVGRPGVAADCANARTRRAWLCFIDESAVRLTPPVRRTWAPKGKTPVLRHPYRRGKQLSMCGLVAYRPGQGDREEPAAWMGFDLLEGAYDTRQCIRVLDGLGHQLGHQPVTVIWDNLGAHHAGDLQAWAAAQPWLALAYLPSYAPELDPVEGLTLLYMSSSLGRVWWGHVLEHGEDLASHVALQAPDDLGLGLALLGPPGQVVPGRLVPAQPDDDDPVQRRVGLAVPAAIQAVARGLAGGGLDR